MLGRNRTKLRAVIYVRGTTVEIDQQIKECTELCERRGHLVVAIARDGPNTSAGWSDAMQLHASGVVDRVVYAGSKANPPHLESVTQALPGYGPVRQVERRSRPMRRSDGAA